MSLQTRLFVGGIPNIATEDNLRKSFSKFGNVLSCEIKKKSNDADSQFAFISIAADQRKIESCIQYFSQSKWQDSQLYVTRARESFLERLQKERQQAQITKPTVVEHKTEENYDADFKIKTPQLSNLNITKTGQTRINGHKYDTAKDIKSKKFNSDNSSNTKKAEKEKFGDEKKLKSDNKRLESMRKMRQQFNEKKSLIKSGLAGVDNAINKKIIFDEDATSIPTSKQTKHINQTAGKSLFDNDEDEDDDVNFEIKEQFEGKRGQKVLELQSRFKSDKRFVLDERFIEDEQGQNEEDETVQVASKDEKVRQLNILQNVLGVELKSSHIQPQAVQDSKKSKIKLGMLRFDPYQPDHAKFLAPKDKNEGEPAGNKKKAKKKGELAKEPERVIEKVEVSKEQFYKVSESLKEAIAQPNNFSLRSLFGNSDQQEDEKDNTQDTGYTSLPAAKKDKVKNPFDTNSKNPFKYDSSDSEEDEETKEESKVDEHNIDTDNLNKAVWKENLFFAADDIRLKDGLAFFNSPASGNKERRELKSLVKKRLYNHSRKDTMFQKKIGGKRKQFGQRKQKK